MESLKASPDISFYFTLLKVEDSFTQLHLWILELIPEFHLFSQIFFTYH